MEKIKTQTIVEFIYVDKIADVSNELIDDGMVIFCKEDNNIYLKLDGEVSSFANKAYAIVDNLTSNYEYRPLSANQGRVLNEKIIALEERVAALEAAANNNNNG